GLKHRPAFIMGVAQGHSDEPRSFTEQPVMSEVAGIRKAAKRAFAMAGLTPKDVDVAELYDCFTSVVLSSIEDIGFCRKGEGGAFVEGGRIELGGELPIITHGGLLSEAHVIGINHVIEAVRQIRGDCGERQVENAEIVLVSGQGYFSEGSIMLLRR
ncbi:MAG: thiolase family protein, partial [Dehalococcoidia bacterium]|nr:thiolase family protein [Dehalococcoidia bacterium]